MSSNIYTNGQMKPKHEQNCNFRIEFKKLDEKCMKDSMHNWNYDKSVKVIYLIDQCFRVIHIY